MSHINREFRSLYGIYLKNYPSYVETETNDIITKCHNCGNSDNICYRLHIVTFVGIVPELILKTLIVDIRKYDLSRVMPYKDYGIIKWKLRKIISLRNDYEWFRPVFKRILEVIIHKHVVRPGDLFDNILNVVDEDDLISICHGWYFYEAICDKFKNKGYMRLLYQYLSTFYYTNDNSDNEIEYLLSKFDEDIFKSSISNNGRRALVIIKKYIMDHYKEMNNHLFDFIVKMYIHATRHQEKLRIELLPYVCYYGDPVIAKSYMSKCNFNYESVSGRKKLKFMRDLERDSNVSTEVFNAIKGTKYTSE